MSEEPAATPYLARMSFTTVERRLSPDLANDSRILAKTAPCSGSWHEQKTGLDAAPRFPVE